MIRTAALVVLALISTWVPVTSASASPQWQFGRWEWVGDRDDPRPVVINLVRGTAHVVRRPGPVRIVIDARSKRVDPNVVRFDVREERDRIAITDTYPKRRLLMTNRECLPPEDARGDFWSNEVWISATVRAPVGVAVDVRFMVAQQVQTTANR